MREAFEVLAEVVAEGADGAAGPARELAEEVGKDVEGIPAEGLFAAFAPEGDPVGFGGQEEEGIGPGGVAPKDVGKGA